MKTEVSLPCSREPSSDSCPEPDKPSPHVRTLFSPGSILILSFHQRLSIPRGLIPSGFPIKNFYEFPLTFMRATRPVHLILLDFITVISGEEHKLWSTSLCCLLQSPTTSSLLGPNILLIILFSNTLNLCSCLCVTYLASQPYKTMGKIVMMN